MKLEKASQEEMKQEALNRMKMLLLHQNVINEFKKENKLNKSEGTLGTLYWLDEEEVDIVKEYEKKWNVLVYHVIKSFTVEMGVIYDLLYITDEKDYWEEERKRLEQGIVLSHTKSQFSESGDIFVINVSGGLARLY